MTTVPQAPPTSQTSTLSFNLSDLQDPPNYCSGCDNIVQKTYACTECSAKGFCDDHFIQHAAHHHAGSELHVSMRTVAVRRAMALGLTAFKMPGVAITAGRTIADPSQSVWFKMADFLGLENPCIFNWRPAPAGDPAALQEREDNINKFVKSMDLMVYDTLPTSNHTFLAAEPSNIDFQGFDANVAEDEVLTVFSPEDTNDAAPTAPNGGWVNDPGSTAGKIIKRHKIKTAAEATIVHDEPSPAGELRTSLRVVKYRKVDTDQAGDGTGKIKQSIAEALLLEGGAAIWGDIIRFQPVAIGRDEGIKGMFNIIPDDLWHEADADVDLIVDTECAFANVLNDTFTLIKMRAIRHRKNTRSFIVDGVMHQQIIAAMFDLDEIVQVAQPLADQLETTSLERAIQGEVEEEFHPLQFLDWNRNSEEDQMAPLLQSESKDFIEAAYNMTGYSPFANANVMEYTTGQVAKHIQSVLRKKREVPSILVSGEALWYQHYEYCIDPQGNPIKSPQRGYARFIWHLRKDDQLMGIAFHKRDIRISYRALDTPDKDDAFYCVFFLNKQEQPCVLILRMPASIGGGYVLRVNQTDYKRLQQLGYHFYRQTGEMRYAGINDADEDGNPLFPDVLQPAAFDNPPQWPVPTDQAIAAMQALTKYRKVIGEACNLTANLDFAGIYDPKRHKFNLSDAVIDPAYMCSADPTPVLMPMKLDILEHIRNGGAMDPCVYPRIADIIEELHYAEQRQRGVSTANLQGLPVRYACNDACGAFKDAMVAIRQMLTQRLQRRQVLANGPVAALVDDNIDQTVVELATTAVAQRDLLWTLHAKRKRDVENDEELSFDAKRVKLAQLWEETRDAERSVTRDAYDDAAAPNGYVLGTFSAAWIQAKLTTTRRFRRVGPHGLDKVTVSALSALPPAEYLAYFACDETQPTVITRATSQKAADAMIPGDVYRFQGEAGSDRYFKIVDSDGKSVGLTEREGGIFTDTDLTFQGIMPRWAAIPSLEDAQKWAAISEMIDPNAPAHRRDLLTPERKLVVHMQRNQAKQPVYFLADPDGTPVIRLTEDAKDLVDQTCTVLPPDGEYGAGWQQPDQPILVFTAPPAIALTAPAITDQPAAD